MESKSVGFERKVASIADPDGDDAPVHGFAHVNLVDPALAKKSHPIKKWLEENLDRPLDDDRGVESPFLAPG